MLYTYSTEKMLELKDATVEKVENIGSEKHIYIHMKKRLHLCPCCKTPTSKVHDYRMQLVRDLPISGLNVVLHLRKRRHVCPKCGKRFYEYIEFLPRYSQFTNRVFLKVLNDLEDCISIKDVAKRNNMSAPTAAKLLENVAWRPTKLPEVLSIDEFRGNSGGEKFQCILTDAKTHKILDVLIDRKLSNIELYLRSFKNRDDVKYVIMDMTGNYRHLMRGLFPNATIVVDRYHYLRQLDFAIEKIRKEAQKHIPDYLRKDIKHSRALLIKNPEKLTISQYHRLQRILDISPQLRKAYDIKQLFRSFRKCETRDSAARALGNWIKHAQASEIPELVTVAQTYANWSKEILNSVEIPYTNGYTEGCNNRIKVIKRISFGMPRFERFRQRILHIMVSEA